MTERWKWTKVTLVLSLSFVLSVGLVSCISALKGKPDPTRTTPGQYARGAPLYWISVETRTHGIPGVPQKPGQGLTAAIMAKMTRKMTGPGRHIFLQLNSRPIPAKVHAAHDIPAGMKMGQALPLLTPAAVEKGAAPPEKMEPPKRRIKFYWGSMSKVSRRQPRVIKTWKMTEAKFAKIMLGHRVPRQKPPSQRKGWVYATWPNQKSKKVPEDASLVGQHFLHGTYIPHMRFTMGPSHDIMKTVKLTSRKGAFKDAMTFKWSPVPNAIGYFVLGLAQKEKTGELIVWSSSRRFEPGFGLLDFLPSWTVRKLVRQKVILRPSTTTCTIPKGIFAGCQGAMLQVVAYGNDYLASNPPRPKSAAKRKRWKPDWVVKARFKSSAMVMLSPE